MNPNELYSNYMVDAINKYNLATEELEKAFNENKLMNKNELYNLLVNLPLRNSFLDKYYQHGVCIKDDTNATVNINYELSNYVLNLCSDIINKPGKLIKSLFD